MPDIAYESDRAVLYRGDCLDILPTLGRDTAHLIVTDPPYGAFWRSNRRREPFARISGDEDTLVALAGLSEALRILRRHRHVYLFGRYDLSTLPLGGTTEIVWDKGTRSGGDLASVWGTSHEYIQFGVCNFSAANRRDGAGRLSARIRRGSVLRYPRINAAAASRHPTEKPVGLLRELIESSSCLGEVVLDPFAGIGSTLVAALLEGRRAIGIELDEGYCGIAAGRLRAVEAWLGSLPERI